MKRYFKNTNIKRVTLNELKKIIKTAKIRKEMHCLPAEDDRAWKLYQIYLDAIEQLHKMGCRTKKEMKMEVRYDREEITSKLIVAAMNDLIVAMIRNNDNLKSLETIIN